MRKVVLGCGVTIGDPVDKWIGGAKDILSDITGDIDIN